MPNNMKHEEIIEIVRNTNNFGDPEGDYDFNGIVHIMLAAMENLKENATNEELEEIKKSFTEEQADYLKLICKYLGKNDV